MPVGKDGRVTCPECGTGWYTPDKELHAPECGFYAKWFKTRRVAEKQE